MWGAFGFFGTALSPGHTLSFLAKESEYGGDHQGRGWGAGCGGGGGSHTRVMCLPQADQGLV